MSIDALDMSTAGDAPTEAARRGRPRRMVAAWLVAAVVTTGSGIGVGVWDAGQSAAHAEGLELWRQARAAIAADLDEATGVVTGAAADGAEDLEAVAALSAVVEEIAGADFGIDPALSRSGDVERARDVVADVKTQRATLGAAVLAARVEHSVWGIDQALGIHEQVVDQLTTRIAESDALLQASAGGVLDDTARDVLAATIESASTALTAAGADGLREELTAVVADLADADDATLESVAAGTFDLGERVVVAADLLASVEDMRVHRELLAQAEQAVVEAQSAWQAEQERIAAEQAAAAAAAQPRSTNTSSGTSSRRGSSSPAPSGSGGVNAPAAKPGSPSSGASGSSGSGATSSGSGGSPSGGGSWVEEGSNTWCGSGDTSGAEGTGGWC